MELGRIKKTVNLLETHLQTLAKEIEQTDVKLNANNVNNVNEFK